MINIQARPIQESQAISYSVLDIQFAKVIMTRYVDDQGILLWSEPQICSRLFSRGDLVVENYQHYIVLKVCIVSNIQYVMLERK